MKFKSLVFIVFIVSISIKSWAQTHPTQAPKYRLYLIGDAGEPGGNPSLDMLKLKLADEGQNSGIIFLGDNIYERGMPLKGSKNRVTIQLFGNMRNIVDFRIPKAYDFWKRRQIYHLPELISML